MTWPLVRLAVDVIDAIEKSFSEKNIFSSIFQLISNAYSLLIRRKLPQINHRDMSYINDAFSVFLGLCF